MPKPLLRLDCAWCGKVITGPIRFPGLQFIDVALQFSSPIPALQDEPEGEAKTNEEDL